MPIYFLESSALVKRYVQEAGTEWIQRLTDSRTGNHLYIAQITGVETVSAISLRLRRGNTSAQDAANALEDFRYDFLRNYVPIQITLNIVLLGMDLAIRHGLRGYDAVQLAAALHLQAELDMFSFSKIVFLSTGTHKVLNTEAR